MQWLEIVFQSSYLGRTCIRLLNNNINAPVWTSEKLTVDELIRHLIGILEDESSIATRLAIIAFKTCLATIFNSVHSDLGLRVLLALLHLKDNPYWLVKVSAVMATS